MAASLFLPSFWSLGHWNLEFIWNLVLVIWNLRWAVHEPPLHQELPWARQPRPYIRMPLAFCPLPWFWSLVLGAYLEFGACDFEFNILGGSQTPPLHFELRAPVRQAECRRSAPTFGIALGATTAPLHSDAFCLSLQSRTSNVELRTSSFSNFYLCLFFPIAYSPLPIASLFLHFYLLPFSFYLSSLPSHPLLQSPYYYLAMR
jgi:hypothetical protein